MKTMIMLGTVALVGVAACRGNASDGTATANTANTASPAGAPARVSGATVAIPETAGVPPSIEAIGHHGENAFDMVKAGNWAAARASTDSLHLLVDSIPGSATIAVRELNLAIANRDRAAALRASNRLTELGARLSEPYHPAVPVEVMLLDHQGRELEIGAAAGDDGSLRRTAATLRRTWATVRPQVVARGGANEAARFDTLVTRVESATTPAQYASLATPVLDAVDSLELVFTR
jgi:hypothetical protein